MNVQAGLEQPLLNQASNLQNHGSRGQSPALAAKGTPDLPGSTKSKRGARDKGSGRLGSSRRASSRKGSARSRGARRSSYDYEYEHEVLEEMSMWTPKLTLLVLAIAVTCAGEAILRKIVATDMFHYRWFLVQLTSLTVVCVSGGYVLKHKTKIERLLSSSPGIFVEEFTWKTLPYKSMFLLGAVDFVGCLCIMCSLGLLNDQLTVLLPFLCHPLNAVLDSLANLATRSRASSSVASTLGRVLILVGIGVALLPFWDTQVHGTWCPYVVDDNHFSNVLLGIAGVAVLTISAFFKRSLLTHLDVHTPFVLNLFTHVGSFVTGGVAGALALDVQYISSAEQPHADFLENFVYGLDCVFRGKGHIAGDVCGGRNSVQVVLYLVSVLAFQLTVYAVMSTGQTQGQAQAQEQSLAAQAQEEAIPRARERPVPSTAQLNEMVGWSVVVSTVVSFLFFSLLPERLYLAAGGSDHPCSTGSQWMLYVGLVCVMVGFVLTIAWQTPPLPEEHSVDVWAQILELEEDERREHEVATDQGALQSNGRMV